MTGLPVLVNVLKNKKGDKEMIRGSLECLNQLVAPTQVCHALMKHIQLPSETFQVTPCSWHQDSSITSLEKLLYASLHNA